MNFRNQEIYVHVVLMNFENHKIKEHVNEII